MERKNEIKKALYKEAPKARFEFVRKGFIYYTTLAGGDTVIFKIPVGETGDADFLPEMEAKHLNKWIYNE